MQTFSRLDKTQKKKKHYQNLKRVNENHFREDEVVLFFCFF